MPLLQAKDVTHYFGGLCAVSHFNLKIDRGELVGIIGPNGAGKTTIFNLITGVYRATQGSIVLDLGEQRGPSGGEALVRAGAPAGGLIELVGKKPNQVTALGIARTFQNIRLFRDLTVLDNVRTANFGQAKCSPWESLFHIGRHGTEEQRITERSLDLLQLMGLDAQADVIARNLPYGLQRRLEIARALATGPSLLLLDEPAAGMNPAEIGQLMQLIQWLRKQFDLTILLIEHQMRLVMGICERITVLDFGATIAEGLPYEIQNNPRVLEAYLGEQEPASAPETLAEAGGTR